MKLTIVPRAENVTHIALDGRLDTTAVEELDRQFFDATAGRERPAIVDLAQVDFLASRGIGMLLASSKALKKAGHKLVLLNPQPLVDSSLRTTRIDLVIPIAYALDEALRLALGEAHAGAAAPPPATRDVAPPAHSVSAAATAPAATAGQLHLSMNNQLSELKAIAGSIAKFLVDHNVPQRAAYAVNLAIDELVTNVIRYAYVDDNLHAIDLLLTIESEQIVLRIVDDGRPFDRARGRPSICTPKTAKLGASG